MTGERVAVTSNGREYTWRGTRWTYEPKNNHGRTEVHRTSRLHFALCELASLRAQVAALAGAKVYTVEWSDYDGHGIIAAFKTHEDADAELAYCKGAPDDFAPSYYTSEYTLGLSEACSLYRFNADGALMHAYFFTRLGDEDRGTVRVYNEPWNDGTCMDVYARSEADARAAIAQHLDAARGGEG